MPTPYKMASCRIDGSPGLVTSARVGVQFCRRFESTCRRSIAVLPRASENPEDRLCAVLAHQTDAEGWDQPPSATDGLNFEESTHESRVELSNAVERTDAHEANVLVKPIMVHFAAVDIVAFAQINLRDRNHVCYAGGRQRRLGVLRTEQAHMSSFLKNSRTLGHVEQKPRYAVPLAGGADSSLHAGCPHAAQRPVSAVLSLNLARLHSHPRATTPGSRSKPPPHRFTK